MSGLDEPTARPAVGVELLQLDLLSPGTDLGGEVVAGDEVADSLVVVGLVEAEALGVGFAWLGGLDRARVERCLQQLVIVAVGAVVIEPERDPGRLDEERALRPPLALSVGLGPVLRAPSGAFAIAPSAASHAQSMPTASS